MDGLTALFGAQLSRCEGDREERLPSREALEGAGSGPLGVYFSFANIGEDELRAALRRAALPSRVVQVVLWAPSSAPDDHRAAHHRLTGDMPWLAVPFDDLPTKRRLTRKFGIKVGAPTLVLVDAAGREICRPSPRQLDTPGAFPWAPRSVQEILAGVPLEREGAPPVSYADLPDDCIKSFYFAAHWCPPCKALTPQLAETYGLVRGRGVDWRVILVSSDRSEEAFERAVAGLPWLRVGWASTNARRELAGALGVHGIPALRVLPPGAAPHDARRQAAGDPDGLNFPWKPGPVNILTDFYLDRLRLHPALVLFVDGENGADLQFAESMLLPVAESYFQEYSILHPDFLPERISPDDDSTESDYTPPDDDACWETPPEVVQKKSFHVEFLIAVESEAADVLRELVADEASLIAVDMRRNRAAVLPTTVPLDSAAVQNFLDHFLSGHVDFRPLEPLNRSSALDE